MFTRSPALHAEALEHVRELADLVEQVAVGDRAGVARLALPVDRDLVALAAEHVPVEAVVGDVESAADEPLGVGQVPLEDGVPRRRPVDEARRLARPERLVVLGGLVVEERPGDECVRLELLRRRELPVLRAQRVDRVVMLAVPLFSHGADGRSPGPTSPVANRSHVGSRAIAHCLRRRQRRDPVLSPTLRG